MATNIMHNMAQGALLAVVFASGSMAHCDTMEGPIIPEARAALAKGDVTPTLKWVMEKDEAEIKAAFAKAVAVRSGGKDAQELADTYFLETLIRIHRAGEGAPYTGLKSEPVSPIVAMSDAAIAKGSVDEMAGKIANHATMAIKEKFAKVAEASKHKDESIKAGREYVEAYVSFTHYVEGLHAAVMSAGGHDGHGDGDGATPHAH